MLSSIRRNIDLTFESDPRDSVDLGRSVSASIAGAAGMLAAGGGGAAAVGGKLAIGKLLLVLGCRY